MKQFVEQYIGPQPLEFIQGVVDINSNQTLCIASGNVFNIAKEPTQHYHAIVNLKRVNDYEDINGMLKHLNKALIQHGIFIGKVETNDLRNVRLKNKFPSPFSRLYILFDLFFKKYFSRYKTTRWFYKFITNDRNRFLTKAEAFGRIYASGFKINKEEVVQGDLYFAASKIAEPSSVTSERYGAIIGFDRVVEKGKLVRFYKFRTMHPYSEYLQSYTYENNNLNPGGKFKNDFRISRYGKFLRKYWIDELPMLWNLMRGDLKWIGVRPVTNQYFQLYSEEVKNYRSKCKPGLIPIIYATMPLTFDQINQAELDYFKQYEKNPLQTNAKYLFKIIFNILFKGLRSN